MCESHIDTKATSTAIITTLSNLDTYIAKFGHESTTFNTQVKTHYTIVHWWNRTARYNLRAPPGAVIFVQDNDDNTSNGKTHTNDGHSDPRYLSKFKCFRCYKFGHFSNKYPNGANTGNTHANVVTKDS